MRIKRSRSVALLLTAFAGLVTLGVDRCDDGRGGGTDPELVGLKQWINDGQVQEMTVHLTDGREVSVEAYGDIVLDADLRIQNLNYTVGGVALGDDSETGLISLSLDPSSPPEVEGSRKKAAFENRFGIRVQYPLISDRLGFIEIDEDHLQVAAEGAVATLQGEFLGEGSISACLHVEIVEPLLDYLGSFKLCGIPLEHFEDNQDPCPNNKKCKETQLCIQPVVFADANGTNPTTCPSFAKTKSIWAKCCKDIQVKDAIKVNKPQFKKPTISAAGNAPSQDMKDIIKESLDDAKAAPNNACVEVYCVTRFKNAAGAEDEEIRGGATTYRGGTAASRIILQSDTAGANVAHEVGHTVGLSHPKDNTGAAKDDGTVMHPSGKNQTAVSEKQSKSNCNKGKKGNCKLKQPKKDCCKTWELDQ